jgi:hypothetical protein
VIAARALHFVAMPFRPARGAMLSLRVTREERKQLLRIRDERGCKYVSDAIRLLLGFPRMPEDDVGIEGMDDIDSVDTLCRNVLHMTSRLEKQTELLIKIAHHVGVPLKGERELPVDLTVLSADANGELIKTGPTRKRPALPQGFAR